VINGGSIFLKVGNSYGSDAPQKRQPTIRGRGHHRLGTWGALVVAVPVLAVGFVAGPAGAGTVGKVSSFAGGGTDDPYGITAGPNGSLWFANFGNNSIGEVSTTGVVSNFTDPSIDEPVGITAGPNGALWFANFGNNSIGEITTTGVVSNFTDSTISKPIDITPGSDGALWFTNQGNNSIGRITTAGSVSNFTHAGIVSPYAITAGPNNSLWFTNQAPGGTSAIGEISVSGSVSIFTNSSITNPYGITADGASLWFTNLPGGSGGSNAIEKMSSTGTVTHTYTDPTLSSPAAIAVGSDGDLWFVNNTNNSIGRITTSGTISNYTDPSIDMPIWIAAGSDGALWFSNNATDSVGQITSAVTPEVKSFTPSSGAVGQKVTVTGKNLDGATAAAVNGTKAKIVSDSATQIVIKVKAGTTTGPITVTTPAGTATSATSFTVS
jgi:virginiamycin B lyase